MFSMPKAVSVLTCGMLLCLGLSQTALALEDEGAVRLQQAKVVKGTLVGIDYGDYIVKTQDGTEIRVHISQKTQVMGQLKKGDRIEAKVDDKDNALLMRSLP
jgi:ribosomal protein S1